MASLLIGAGYLAYEKASSARAARAERAAERKRHNAARFAALEAENAARIRALQEKTYFCRSSDWDGARGGGCGGATGAPEGVGGDDNTRGRRGSGGEEEEGIEGEGLGRRETTGETENAVVDAYYKEEEEERRELVVPDVRGVRPRVREEQPCAKRTLKERVLRRKRKEGCGAVKRTGVVGGG
ncbi:MAG: hypothetical protein LQ344_006838 [Seirophora lacunosa]|nr:MAG: hypothetical protein LQ344_006838 [Seirophora lacunosa]